MLWQRLNIYVVVATIYDLLSLVFIFLFATCDALSLLRDKLSLKSAWYALCTVDGVTK